MDKYQKHQIKNLLGVIGASVLAAGALTYFFIYNYGPSGKYVVDQVLLNPTVLEDLNYNDNNPKIAHDDRYIFDAVEYVNGAQKVTLTKPQYEQVYAALQGRQSLDSTEELEEQFSKGETPSSLTIYVKTESSSAWQKDVKIFQEVQFIENAFRILLHENNPGGHWVYFDSPQIKQIIQSIVSP